MALGLTSKILIFTVVANAVIGYAGVTGMIDGEMRSQAALEYIDRIGDEAEEEMTEVGAEEDAGFINLDFFNPLSYIWGAIQFVIGIFIDVPLLAWQLPAPGSWILGPVITALQATAIISIVRGVAA